MADTIEKIYDLKTLGGASVLRDLQSINTEFERIKATKQALNDQKSTVTDPEEIAELNKQIKQLTVQMEMLTKAFKAHAASAKEVQIIAEQEVSAQSEVQGAFTETGNVVEAVGSRMAATLEKIKGNVGTTILEFVAWQSEVTKSNVSQDEFNDIQGAAIARLVEVRKDIATVKAEMIDFNKALKDGTMSEEEWVGMTEKATGILEGLNVELETTSALVKSNATLYARQNDVFQEQSEAVALNKEQLRQQNIELKLNAQLENAVSGSIGEARAQRQSYNRELTLELDLTTELGNARAAELRTLIDERDEFIKLNSDKYTRQKINIGNYPSVGAEISDLTKKMQALVLAGKQNEAEYQAQAVRLQELRGAVAAVRTETAATTSVSEQFTNIVQRMGLRFIANIAIFQIITSVISDIGQHFSDSADHITEFSKQLEKAASGLDKFKKLQEDYQKLSEHRDQGFQYITNQNSKQGADALNQELPALERRLKILQSEELTGKDALADKEKSKQLDKDIYDQQIAIANRKIEIAKANISALTPEQEDGGVHNLFNQPKINELQNQIKDLEADKEIAQNELNKKNQDKYRNNKKPQDLTNVDLQAYNKEQAFLAEQAEEKIKQDQLIQQQTFENSTLGIIQSLNDRLAAYAKYVDDQKQLLYIEEQTEVGAVQHKLDKIAEYEALDKSKRTNEQNKLIEQKAEFLAQEDAIEAKYTTRHTARALENAKRTLEITKSALQDQFALENSQYTEQLNNVQQDVNNRLATLYGNKGISPVQKDDKAEKITDKASKERLDILLTQNQDEVAQLNQLHDAKLISEAEYQSKLGGLLDQEANLRKGKQDLQLKDFQKAKEIQEFAITQLEKVADSAANAYIEGEQKKAEVDFQNATNALNFNKTEALAHAQSAQQQLQIEQQFNQAQTNLTKQKANEDKKIKEEQLTIEFALAEMKVIASALVSTDPTSYIRAIIEGASLAGIYATNMALMNQATFAQGGAVPSSGGSFGGRSHSQGGTPFTFQGQSFEAEAGELAIINKRSASASQILNVSGTPKQIASAINSFGGGVDFSPGADMRMFGYGGTLGANLQAPIFPSFSATASRSVTGEDMQALTESFAAVMQQGFAAVHNRIDNIRVQVVTNDITSSQNKNAKRAKVGTL